MFCHELGNSCRDQSAFWLNLKLHCVPKGFNFLPVCNFVKSWPIFNFCIAGKRTKFVTGCIWQCPPHLRYVATLPWESKTSNFLQIWKKTGTDCIAVIEDLEHVLASLKRFWGWSIVSPLGGAEPLGEPDTLNLKSHNSVTPWVNISKF